MTERKEAGRRYIQDNSFMYEIVRPIAVLADYGPETKEINLIQYNHRSIKYDIRSWGKDDMGRAKMLKGLTLSDIEARRLYLALKREFEEEDEEEEDDFELEPEP